MGARQNALVCEGIVSAIVRRHGTTIVNICCYAIEIITILNFFLTSYSHGKQKTSYSGSKTNCAIVILIPLYIIRSPRLKQMATTNLKVQLL